MRFEEIIEVFFDENRLERYDYDHSTLYEERYCIIGTLGKGLIIFVICLFSGNDTIRIISARKASTKEREDYYGQDFFRRS